MAKTLVLTPLPLPRASVWPVSLSPVVYAVSQVENESTHRPEGPQEARGPGHASL